MQFFHEKFAVTSVIKIYTKMSVSRQQLIVYFINFQIRQIWAINQNFEGHDHWHCSHILFELITIFQSRRNDRVEI